VAAHQRVVRTGDAPELRQAEARRRDQRGDRGGASWSVFAGRKERVELRVVDRARASSQALRSSFIRSSRPVRVHLGKIGTLPASVRFAISVGETEQVIALLRASRSGAACTKRAGRLRTYARVAEPAQHVDVGRRGEGHDRLERLARAAGLGAQRAQAVEQGGNLRWIILLNPGKCD
jgi:hypothetical protein